MKYMFKSFDQLNNEMKNCRKCELCNNRKNVVCGEGNLKAQVMLIAEAPGYNEDKTGKPFVGRAGKIIDEALFNLNITREDVFISNIVKCNPPNNRNPNQQEVDCCLDYLRNQVLLINPKVIILLGSVALKTILGDSYSITKCRGQLIKKKGILYIPTWHPAAVLRDINKKAEFINDFVKAFNSVNK